NSKAYKEYYACAMGEAAPKLKASARKKKGDSASSTTPPTLTPTTTVVSAPRLSATAKGTDKGTGSKPMVPDVPSDDSEEELSWNSSDDEEGDEQTQAGSKKDKDDDDNDEEEELAKNDEEDTETGKGGDEVSESEGESDEEETRQEEEGSFDPIPRTPEGTFRFDERLRSLETSFSEYRQTNPFVNAVSAIPGIVQHGFIRNRTKENLYNALVEAYDADKAILDTYGDSTILKRRREDDDQEGPFAGSDRGSKRQKEGGEHASTSTPSETSTEGAGRSTTRSQSRQLSASADDQPIVQTSQHPEWFSQPRRPPSPDRAWNKTLPNAQGDAQSWISDLARQTDARSSFNELL
nr:hypothetical protein [Tanacetum cinerariifolium]